MGTGKLQSASVNLFAFDQKKSFVSMLRDQLLKSTLDEKYVICAMIWTWKRRLDYLVNWSRPFKTEIRVFHLLLRLIKGRVSGKKCYLAFFSWKCLAVTYIFYRNNHSWVIYWYAHDIVSRESQNSLHYPTSLLSSYAILGNATGSLS